MNGGKERELRNGEKKKMKNGDEVERDMRAHTHTQTHPHTQK